MLNLDTIVVVASLNKMACKENQNDTLRFECMKIIRTDKQTRPDTNTAQMLNRSIHSYRLQFDQF